MSYVILLNKNSPIIILLLYFLVKSAILSPSCIEVLQVQIDLSVIQDNYLLLLESALTTYWYTELTSHRGVVCTSLPVSVSGPMPAVSARDWQERPGGLNRGRIPALADPTELVWS